MAGNLGGWGVSSLLFIDGDIFARVESELSPSSFQIRIPISMHSRCSYLISRSPLLRSWCAARAPISSNTSRRIGGQAGEKKKDGRSRWESIVDDCLDDEDERNREEERPPWSSTVRTRAQK